MSKHIRFDWAMKRLLRNKVNHDVLEGFLSVLLRDDIKITEILESEGNKEEVNDKYNRVDILVKNSKNELLLIEVQNERENDYFHRMNYGQAKLTTEYLYESDEYAKIKKVYSINIVYFDLGQGNDYVYVGRTQFRGLHTNEILELNTIQKKIYPVKEISDIYATYYLLKVNSFNDVAKDSLDEWIYFLKHSEIKDEFTAKGLKEAKEKLRRDILSPTEKVSYEKYIKAKRIGENVHKSALLEGEMKAQKKYKVLIEDAKKKEKEATRKIVELAKFLKSLNVPVEQIINKTGLSKEDIEKI